MKKIAITTYWDTHTNYGQLLQGYALQKVLKDNGYSPYIIKYTLKEENSLYSHIINRLKNGFKLKKFFDGSYYNRINKSISIPKNDLNKSRNFDAFRKKMSFSEMSFDSYSELKKFPPEADIYLTGSDQVWASWIRNNTKRIYLLDFGAKDIKRIAFSASFSRDTIKSKENRIFKRCLKKFSFLGIREQSGVEICHKLGFNHAKLVADPTLLLTKEEWLQLAEDSKLQQKKEEFAFAYMVDTTKDNPNVKKTIEYLKEQETPLVYTSSALYEDELSNCRPSIESWINYIKNAKYVVTSSYHGTIFCLIMNTPFLVVAKHGKHKQNTRLHSLLEKVNLTDRVIDETKTDHDIQVLLNKDINWGNVNSIIKDFRNESLTFLFDAIKDN